MVNGEMNWKDLSGYVFDRIVGKNVDKLSDEDCERLDRRAAALLKEIDVVELLPMVENVMNLNILDKNIKFKELERFPSVWQKIYAIAIDIVAAENRQAILAK